MKKNNLWLLAVVLLMSSCTQRLIDFTIISSKNVPITDKGTEFQKATSRVKGVDSKWSVLFVPGIPNMKEAIDRAIEQYPGAVALTDGVVYQKSWTCFLLGQNKYIVEGTPLYPDTNNGNPVQNTQETINRFTPAPQQPVIQNEPQVTNVLRVTHIVGKGETLIQIAAAYKVNVVDIMKWNELSSNAVTPGMKLIIFINQ
ncbi:MAG: LysM peptidoglycan-binding domain-containing protein [Bacteroidales bacterium]|nr:LysM peptidoglycan-binding domain-containing protein [Bacteroidales bacterium]